MASSVQLIRAIEPRRGRVRLRGHNTRNARFVFLAGACPLNDDGTTTAVGDYAGQAAVLCGHHGSRIGGGGCDARDVINTRVLVASSSQADLVATPGKLCGMRLAITTCRAP